MHFINVPFVGNLYHSERTVFTKSSYLFSFTAALTSGQLSLNCQLIDAF